MMYFYSLAAYAMLGALYAYDYSLSIENPNHRPRRQVTIAMVAPAHHWKLILLQGSAWLPLELSVTFLYLLGTIIQRWRPPCACDCHGGEGES